MKLPFHEYYNDFKDLILAYFLVIDARYQALYVKVFSEHIFTEYLKTVLEDYEIQQAVFVDLEVKEYIEILGKEVQAKGEQQKARQDTILKLRQTVTENQMMLLGQAGMGKTTSLLFLAKKDAEELLKTNKKSILPSLPVYITLASFNNETDTIVDKIANRLERKIDFTENYLREGKITLFLDGFNEVLERLQTQMIRIIQQFIDDFPKTKIIIASRPLAYEEIEFKQSGTNLPQNRKPIPAFLLLELKEDLVKDFLKKNYQGNADKLFAEISKTKALLDSLNNPLYLAEFISIYEEGQQIPASLTIITSRFIEKKYKREKEKIDATFNKIEFAKLMAEYTQNISVDDKFGMANPQVHYRDAKKIIEEAIKEQKAETNTDRFLKNAISMNLLIKNREGTYSFAHQSYQDFFADYDEY